MEGKKETISFMFPVVSGVMGGVQNILLKIIPAIIKDNAFKVRLYDYKCGLIYNELKKLNLDNIEYILLDAHLKKIPNKGNEIFLFFGFSFLRYAPYFSNHNNVRILNWDVYYPEWNQFYKIKSIPIPFLKNKVINLINKTNSFIFMEETSLEVLKDTKLELEKFTENNIISVPVFLQKNNYLYKNKDMIKIGYIGRAVNWKIYPVEKFLKDLSKLNKKFELHIFTNSKINFENALTDIDNVVVQYHIGVFGDKLENIIKNEINLGFSMGTAALDFAKHGIPTILADFSYSNFPEDYKYRWLKDSNIGDLGQEVNSEFYVNSLNKRKTLKKMIQEFEIKPLALSEESYTSVVENHDISKIKYKLYTALKKTELKSSHFLDILYRIIAFKTYIRRKINDKKYIWRA